MELSKNMCDICDIANDIARSKRKEYLIPEHILMAIMQQPEGKLLIDCFQIDWEEMKRQLEESIDTVDSLPESAGENYQIELSEQSKELFSTAAFMAEAASKSQFDVPHILHAIMLLDDSFAKDILFRFTTYNKNDLLRIIIDIYEGENPLQYIHNEEEPAYSSRSNRRRFNPTDLIVDDEEDEEDYLDYDITPRTDSDSKKDWEKLCTCINDILDTHNPLIGRENEIERTIQVLCRKDKNNPLHIGEPGVGKTAIVYGLAERIESGDVPEKLKGARIYQVDLGTLIAGTQYRGEFEKRIKCIMNGATEKGKAIIYIDEIHTLVGSGAIGESSLDASNMLKPYLEAGTIRFIGSTTYQEYNKYFQKSKGLVRRFQQIDIAEPSIEETIKIIYGLRGKYEDFHHVRYSDEVIRHTVEMSAKYINERFLPDKAIDLIDEAGAFTEINISGEPKEVTIDTINTILSRICKIDPNMLKEEENDSLEDLEKRISSQIFGQDEAIGNVVQAVQMGKAGLLDDEKPVASLLFVGPTGVGKTEVCRVLAKELGIELIRFDMSEYAEKHTIAKLIGSPAGYVGYEEGGLLTDAIRKTPHCVLLLDEIEKAHADIYNILLQVMDYARLTDNKGQKADFRHVILVMTSNAGAQFAHQASVGFGNQTTAGDAMMQTVKKTFKPEFIARLSGTVVFNDMDKDMASLILDKKLRILSDKLRKKNVRLQLTPSARELLLSLGFNKKSGAREMDRLINQMLSPTLTKEILFGRLKKGGIAIVDEKDKQLCFVDIENDVQNPNNQSSATPQTKQV